MQLAGCTSVTSDPMLAKEATRETKMHKSFIAGSIGAATGSPQFKLTKQVFYGWQSNNRPGFPAQTHSSLTVTCHAGRLGGRKCCTRVQGAALEQRAARDVNFHSKLKSFKVEGSIYKTGYDSRDVWMVSFSDAKLGDRLSYCSSTPAA